ncbi:MAG: ATP-binding cassette domain-containing protein, partial [ANME-2 cluster archaeon]|nr:ATP-binding cassette domain-containing protein [ANME-2 cluster archaeon]
MIPIEVHNLTKRFGELTAVDNLDLEVKAGEFFGFLGPNGAGKTTTLQMLSG